VCPSSCGPSSCSLVTSARLTDLLSRLSQCTNTSDLVKIPNQYQIPYLPPNLGLFVCSAYCVLYVLLEPVAGTALAALLLAGTAWANHLTSTYGMTANYYAFAAHIGSWIAQFVGHGKFEGRKPALLDNLFQAFFLAPLFVWLEVFFMLGYRPDLQQRIEGLVLEDIAKFKAEQKQTVNGKTNGNTDGRAVNGHAKAS
jgi:2-hydroxy fatty acid dioxygenase